MALANNGQPPGSRLFERETGIRQKQWQGVYWARWSAAIADAGLLPNLPTEKLPDDAILEKLAIAFHQLGQVASAMELRIYRRTNPDLPTDKTIDRRFGTRANLLRTLADWVSNKVEYLDVAVMLTDCVAAPDDQVATERVKEGLVYLIRSGPHYKIGRSDELERRVKEIKVAMPETASLVHSIRTDDPPGIEAYWHRRFADKRANGEWFKLSASDVAAFKRRKFQ